MSDDRRQLQLPLIKPQFDSEFRLPKSTRNSTIGFKLGGIEVLNPYTKRETNDFEHSLNRSSKAKPSLRNNNDIASYLAFKIPTATEELLPKLK